MIPLPGITGPTLRALARITKLPKAPKARVGPVKIVAKLEPVVPRANADPNMHWGHDSRLVPHLYAGLTPSVW